MFYNGSIKDSKEVCMLPIILLVFPLVLIYLYLRKENKKLHPKERPLIPKETCAYCDLSRNIH